MGKLNIRTQYLVKLFATLSVVLSSLNVMVASAQPIAPTVSISITPTVMRPAQAGMITVNGGYPLNVTATLNNKPLLVAWTGEAYMATFSFNFNEPAGDYTLVVDVVNNITGEQLNRTETITILDFSYPEEIVALPFSLIPLLEPSLNEAEVEHLDEIYATQSRQSGVDFPFAVPVPGGIVTSGFGGDRTYNGGIWQAYHTGADFRRRIGESVLASADGIVVSAELFDVRGNVVIIHHGLGIYSQYAHLSEIVVKEGEHIRQGELLGLAGATGRINGPHLHFEIIVDGNPIDPIRWFALTPGFAAPPQLPPRQSSEEENNNEEQSDAQSVEQVDGETETDTSTPVPDDDRTGAPALD